MSEKYAVDIRLRPCPFCSATPTSNNLRRVDVGQHRVACYREGCGAMGPHGVTIEEALEKWNHQPVAWQGDSKE